MSLKSGMHILQSWTFSGDKPALGVLIWHSYRFTLFRRCLLILNSTPSTWKQRSDSEVHVDFTGGREHHHNSTSDTWKNHSTGLCSGNGVGIKLRSSCSHQAQDRRTGCGPRRKASSTIHSSVNGFYQDHILWWPVQKYTIHPVYLNIWVEQVAGVQEIVKQTQMLQMAKRPSFLGLNNIPYIPDICYPFIHQWTLSLFLSLG